MAAWLDTMAARAHGLSHVIYLLLVAGHGALRAASLSFNFDFSNPSTFSLADFTMAGDAKFHGAFFDLTANEYDEGIDYSVGRVSYVHPVQLRDNATGEVASFTTAFSFNIAIVKSYKGDGMAFFLARYPLAPALPSNSRGGALGLCAGCTVNKTAGQDRFVAVEFDTFNNTWDPSVTSDHMGIDVDSVVSVANISLPSFSLNGTMCARVEYNGSNSTKTRCSRRVPRRLSTLAPRWISGPCCRSILGGNRLGHRVASGALLVIQHDIYPELTKQL
jgi:hypothetical protein